MGKRYDGDWLEVLRRRAAGLPDEETNGDMPEVPIVVGIFDQKPKTAADFKKRRHRVKKLKPDAETVELLAEMLERAKAGEIVGFIGLTKEAPNPAQPLKDHYDWFRTGSMDADKFTVIGQLSVLEKWFAEEALDEVLGVDDFEGLEGENV